MNRLIFSLFFAVFAVSLPTFAAPLPKDLQEVPTLDEEGGATKWAVVIGVSKYAAPGINLRYAADDAAAFARTLQKSAGVPADHIKLLTDEAATTKNVRTALGTWLTKVARRQDTVYIFFSGHGAPDLDKNVAEDGVRKYLVTHDSEPSNLFATGFPLDDLSAALLRMNSERTAVFLDCCYSGAGITAGSVGLPRTFFRPGVEVEGRLKGGFVDTLARSGRGRAVMTACNPNERSWEYTDLKHGAFTYNLIRGLEGAAAQNGNVDINSLYAYVYNQLATPTAERQPQEPLMSTTLSGVMKLNDASIPTITAKQGSVKILSSPLDAQVLLDRDPNVLQTPFEKPLSEGSHNAVIWKEGYLPVREEFYVTAGRPTVLSYVLNVSEPRGDLLILGQAGARVSIDSREAGNIGTSGYLRLPDVDATTHRVRVEADGFTPLERTLSVQAGAPSVEKFLLARAMGGLRPQLASEVVAGLVEDNGRFRWQKDGAEMVFVSPGPFIMGRDEEEDSRPPHTVNLPGFWMDKTEVSNAQFAKFVREAGYAPKGGWVAVSVEEQNRPATNISLEDARAYAAWVGKVVPSEAQWEKAARGTDSRLFTYGNTFKAALQNNRAYGYGGTLNVGTFPTGASPYGCLDMLGNVWEWCDTQFGPYAGGAGAIAAPTTAKTYVLRGGSFLAPALSQDLTVTTRAFLQPTLGQRDVGFRCAVLVP